MGSTSACTAEKSFIAAYCPSYKLEMKPFGAQNLNESGSLSGSSEGVMAADLGLAIAGSTMDANNFKIHSILSKASSMHMHANPADVKALKKPDKALPCPRCNSLDTKFCYYNNYNVNQPRHFCKGCQRYWTAGGTLRNVAIGAGRRKRKHVSLESDSQDSTVEECSSQDLPVKVLASVESGSVKDKCAHGGVSQVVNNQMFPLERIQCAAFSNQPSPSVEKSSLSESLHRQRVAMPYDKVEPLCSSHNFREQARTFYEYLRPKHTETQLDNAPCSFHEGSSVHVEHLKKSTLNLHAGLQHGGKLVPSTSSEMQASNESGCASSLSTQALSVDACVTDGKSDVMDSEVTMEGDELDKRGSYVGKVLETACLSPHKMHTDGGKPAASSFLHCDSSNIAAIAPTWKGPAAVKPAWPTINPALTWGPSADKALSWGFPWGPAAQDVDAAKAALIPNAGSSPKNRTEPKCSPEMRLWVPKTLRIKDADEAARSSIWSILGIKDRQGSKLAEKVEAVSQCHGKEGSAATTPSQQPSPVALMQSMAFQKSS